jgi:hypothetical protein
VTDDVYTNSQSIPFMVKLRAMCDTANATVEASFGADSRTLEFTQPLVFQDFEMEIRSPAEAMAMTLSAEGVVGLNIASLSVRRMDGLVYSDPDYDYLYLARLIDPKILTVVDANTADGTPNDEFFTVRVYRRGGVLLPDSDVSFDWVNRVLSVRNSLYNYTHYVAIYADTLEFGRKLGCYDVEPPT